MRLDLELFRAILLVVEESPTPTVKSNYSLRFEGIPPLTSDYHVHLLIQEGFLYTIDARCKDREYDYLEIGLTIKGQQFIDAIADRSSLDKIKDYIKANALPLTLDVLFKVAMTQFS